MTNTNTLKHIAALYLDTYAGPRDLARPLTPEQVKDAARLLQDLLTANEAELLLEQERRTAAARPEPTCEEIAQMFMDRYRRDTGIDGPLSEADWYAASEVFHGYISTIS